LKGYKHSHKLALNEWNNNLFEQPRGGLAGILSCWQFKMLRLQCKVQQYAWGKVGSDSAVAQLYVRCAAQFIAWHGMVIFCVCRIKLRVKALQLLSRMQSTGED
jgi:hypothetical protein